MSIFVYLCYFLVSCYSVLSFLGCSLPFSTFNFFHLVLRSWRVSRLEFFVDLIGLISLQNLPSVVLKSRLWFISLDNHSQTWSLFDIENRHNVCYFYGYEEKGDVKGVNSNGVKISYHTSTNKNKRQIGPYFLSFLLTTLNIIKLSSFKTVT
ncbi:hypothetical protein J3Q64DRAFT_1693536 [Phycomyces blakesleeanus]|uniref:Uncharacterized protein n=1 Tax=Phycomyces blakesleeanus TaxID=4837 RepID=A0ABR3BE41_PHYBL